MAARSVWTGYIRFSLVSIPVKAYTATASGGGKISLNQFYKACGSRIKYQKVCPTHGELKAGDIVSGYPNTTGLPRSLIQWRITDHVADPPGLTEAHHSEQLIRLPGSFLCYRPPDDAPAVEPPPFEKTGQITFGSFNQLAKVSSAILEVLICGAWHFI